MKLYVSKRKSEADLVCDFAKEFEKRGYLTRMEYYVGSDISGLYNARFDLVIHNDKNEILAVMEVKRTREKVNETYFLVTKESLAFYRTKQIAKYFCVLNNYNIPLFWAKLCSDGELKDEIIEFVLKHIENK